MTKSRDKNRAVTTNIEHRFSKNKHLELSDVWWYESDEATNITELFEEQAKTIVTTNQSPDVPFSQTINPYRGCEHGCIYCYARPSHAYWDYSPGYDFESKIIYKPNAAELLKKKFNSRSYQCQPIVIGANTDAYQPVEKNLKITRQLLKIFIQYKHPVSIITKSQLILRDLDLLTELADKNLVSVAVSVTTLKNSLKRTLEPRTASPQSRLATIEKLSSNNIPVTTLVAPVIPGLNDDEIEMIIEQVSQKGASNAAYILLRLPYEVKPLFIHWLETHYPLKKQKVLNYLTQMRQGKLNTPEFNDRMSGQGVLAKLIKQRFNLACHKAGLNTQRKRTQTLDTSLFTSPGSQQIDLFEIT
ncbi:PA0069 family radical SAM protein [Aliikangiella sp. IMCC44359]|uniref:PA0069 family radical SAM protein n=1 Tax=Aliikangiella sp. IMCC44359 TaxID=3459125 RepID=UPI00403B27B1